MSTPQEQQVPPPPAPPAAPASGGGGKKGMMIAGVIVVLLVLVAVAAFLLYTPPPPAGSKCQTTDNKIKVGVALDQTGDIAQIGTAGVEAIKMRAEEINAAGGVSIGGSKCMIDLMIETDGCDPAKGTTAANKLVGVDKVQVIIGGSCSSACLAIDAVANQSMVPQITPSCTGPQLSTRPYIFRTVPSDAYQSVAMIDLVMGLKAAGKVGDKVAVFSMNNAYGVGLHNAVIKAAADKGLTVIVKDTYDTAASTFEPQLQVIKNAKATSSPTQAISVLLTSYNTPGVVIFTGANKLGMNQSTGFQWISNDGIVDAKELVDDALSLDALQGLWGTKPTARDPTEAKYKNFLAAYKLKYSKDAIVYVPESYDALSVAVAAIEKAGEYNGAKIKAALNSFTGSSCFVGVSGDKCYDANGDLNAKGAYYVIYHVEGKVYKTCASYWDGVMAADGVKNFDGTTC